MELILKITTLSDTQIGSGRSFGAVIDSDIEFDRYGLPYIPAKRIKGLFRNAVEDLRNLGLLQFNKDHLEALFGKEGSECGAPIIFDNLMLENHEQLHPWLEYLFSKYENAFNTHLIQDYFTTLRSQTAIDRDTKTAKDHSLRTIRVLKSGISSYNKHKTGGAEQGAPRKKNFVFCGKIYLQATEDEAAFINALSMATLLIRRIGGQRNRGFGKVEVELFDANGSLTEKVKKELEARQ